MAKMKNHKRVGKDYLEAAKNTPHARHAFSFPASHLWNALLDDEAWTQWQPITNVEWTSPKPFGMGTTRTVTIDKFIVEETFFIWEEGKRMAFSFDRSNFPVSAGVEDYQIVETQEGCELLWTVRLSAPFPFGWFIQKQFIQQFSKGLSKLEHLIESDPSRFQ